MTTKTDFSTSYGQYRARHPSLERRRAEAEERGRGHARPRGRLQTSPPPVGKIAFTIY